MREITIIGLSNKPKTLLPDATKAEIKSAILNSTIHCLECDQQVLADEYAFGHDCEEAQ